MGGGSSKDEIIARLDKLDKEEEQINKELRELQLELNKHLPDEEKLTVLPLDQGFVPKKKHNPFKDVKEGEGAPQEEGEGEGEAEEGEEAEGEEGEAEEGEAEEEEEGD